MAKIDLNRVSMPKQEPLVRAKNFNEVALGYNAEMAWRRQAAAYSVRNAPALKAARSVSISPTLSHPSAMVTCLRRSGS